VLALSGTAGCWQAAGPAGGFVHPRHCSQGVYLELLICIHKHDHVNWLLRPQPLSPPSAGTSSPFPSQMSRYLCFSLYSAPWPRMEKQLEKGKKQRMGESTSLEPVTDTHCHHLCSAKKHLENKLKRSSGGEQELCRKPCSPGQQ